MRKAELSKFIRQGSGLQDCDLSCVVVLVVVVVVGAQLRRAKFTSLLSNAQKTMLSFSLELSDGDGDVSGPFTCLLRCLDVLGDGDEVRGVESGKLQLRMATCRREKDSTRVQDGNL